MTGVLVGNSADSSAQQLLSKGSQTPVQVSTRVPDNSEPRTPNNEPPSSASRLNGGSPTSSPRHAAAEAANQAAPGRHSSWGLGLGIAQQERTDWSRGFSRLFEFFLAGAAAPATRRGYDKWNDTEEDLFFAALKPTVGCLPNVVCTAASKRIRTKDYVQVCAPDTACCPAVCAATDRVLGIFTARTQCHAQYSSAWRSNAHAGVLADACLLRQAGEAPGLCANVGVARERARGADVLAHFVVAIVYSICALQHTSQTCHSPERMC